MSDDQAHGVEEEQPTPGGRSLTEPEMQELLPAYVLGALEGDEMLAVDAYLQEHPEWQGRLHSLELAATSLAHAAPRAPLPVRVKERLLEQARAGLPVEPTRPPAQHAASRRRGSRLGAAPSLPAQNPTIRGLRSIPPIQPHPVAAGPGWFGVFWRSVVAAGAVAVILLLSVLTWQLRTSVTSLAQQISNLESQLAQLQSENDQLQATNSTLQQQLQLQIDQLAILTDPQQTIALAGTEAAPSASGEFHRRGSAAVVILRGLPPLSSEQNYQLWILPPDGGFLPADLITVTNPAAQTISVTLPAEYSNPIGVGISIEPAGGNQTPTTIVLLGTTIPAGI
jgi:anti-sigma-K factor RskA